jgi:hypothetical protein
MHNPIMKIYVVVVSNLTYGGKAYKSGAEIQLVEAEAAPLIDNGSIKLKNAA